MVVEPYFSDCARRDWEVDGVDGTVRLALVGLGSFVRERALPGIASGERCEASVLVTGSPERGVRLADEYDVEHLLSYDEFHVGERVDAYDAVYVGTPNALHDEYVLAAAEHGAHVLCEKPLSVSADRARRLRDACADAGVTLMTGYRLQAEPTIRRTRELVRDGVVGEIVQAHGSFSHSLLASAGPDDWRLDPDLAGGGALIDLGIHSLNAIRYVLDEDPAGVYASTHASGPPFDAVDEHVAFQLEFPTGATASCTASFDAHPHSQLQLVGTDGVVTVDSPFGGVVPQHVVVESGEVRVEHTGEPVDEVREEFDYFGYHVLADAEPEPNGDDAVTDLEVIEAAYEAAVTNRCVELE